MARGIIAAIDRLIERIELLIEVGRDMTASFDRLTADVNAAVTEIASLSSQISAVVSGTSDAALDELSAKLEAAIGPLKATTSAITTPPAAAATTGETIPPTTPPAPTPAT